MFSDMSLPNLAFKTVANKAFSEHVGKSVKLGVDFIFFLSNVL